MKKLLPVAALLCIAFTPLKAQQGLFKLSVLQGHTYSAVNTTHIKEDIDYTGDTRLVNMTKKMSEKHGFKINSVTRADNSVTQNNDGSLLFKAVFSRELGQILTSGQDSVGEHFISKEKGVIYGKYIQGNSVLIDSVSKVKLDDNNILRYYTDLLSSTQPSIHFPSTPLRIGDSFIDTEKIATPGPGLLVRMQTITTYKLTAIANEKAFFDTEIIVQLATKIGDMWTIESEGAGKMVYDMGMNYPLHTIFNLTVNYTILSKGQPNNRLNGELNIASDQQNTITF